MLRVLHRDEHLLAVSKPSGMVVHRGWADDAVTAADIVRDEIIDAPVHAIHRLDRGTSGILLFALNADAARLIQVAMASGKTQKRYLALVRGPMKDGCVLDHPVPQRDRDERVDAVTEFKPLSHSGRWSLVEALPRTGRLHQIRRHLKHLSHPIVGDVRYGKGDVNRLFREQYGLRRMALHLTELTLPLPTGELLRVHDPIPPDLLETLEALGMTASVTLR